VKHSPLFADGFVLIWKRERPNAEEEVLAMDTTILTGHRFKVNVRHDGEKPGSTLKVSLAQAEDAGKYVCQLGTNGRVSGIVHTLSVRGE